MCNYGEIQNTDDHFLFELITAWMPQITRRINNFVKAVEAAADVKKENLAIERKLAEDSSVTEVEREQTRQTWCKYLKVSIPWIVFILIMVVTGYFIISSNV